MFHDYTVFGMDRKNPNQKKSLSMAKQERDNHVFPLINLGTDNANKPSCYISGNHQAVKRQLITN